MPMRNLCCGLTVLLAACAPPEVTPRTIAPEFHNLGAVNVTRDELCARGNADAIADALCAVPRAPIDSLDALRGVVGLRDDDLVHSGQAMVTHSTSLFGRHVTPINPRMIFFHFSPASGFIAPNALAFTRGSPLVELVTADRVTGDLRFYLVRFEPACGDHCTLAEQLTPAIEKGWTNVWFSEDRELENTTLDCLHCHQPSGPGTPKMLRIHELRRPWTHWADVGANSPVGAGLLGEFKASRPSFEGYAAQSMATLQPIPADLEQLMDDDGFANQPQLFDSDGIAADPGLWKSLYQRSLDARQMPVPVPDLHATDPDRQAAASQRYLEVANGQRPASELLDTRAIMTVDSERKVRVRPHQGAGGRDVIVEVCGACHNSTLNQNISRARFNVDRLEEQKSGENAIAITRLKLPATDPLHMPPEMSGELTEDEIEAAVSALK